VEIPFQALCACLWGCCRSEDAEHAIESVDANLAVGPVIHRSPAQPVAVLEAAKDSLDFLLPGIAHSDWLCAPIHPVGEQHRATQTMIDEPLPGSSVEFKLQPPVTIILGFDLIAN